MSQTLEKRTDTRTGPRVKFAAVTLAFAAAIFPATASTSVVVTVADGTLRGTTETHVEKFLGIPYAHAPVDELRWKPPQAAIAWGGERDASAFGPGCPQNATPFGVASTSEDCLYLNVFAPAVPRKARRPVMVWIHGGGLTLGESHDYDPTQLAANGTVVVTINYRLGALGFLAHPALIDHESGSSGNYGWMDQQAALRWVQRNIDRFGGDPKNVTIAGQSAGGLSVLAQLVSPGAQGLFHRVIVQSGDFALKQTPLVDAEKTGAIFAQRTGCADQSAECLRKLPVTALLANQEFAYIPGVVDGKVLQQSIGAALAKGDFHRVPILNGVTHDEQRIFSALGVNVSGGKLLPVQGVPISGANYQGIITSALGVSGDVAKEIVAHYPLSAYKDPSLAFSALATDASFACPAHMANQWTSKFVPTYAYEFNESTAPQRFLPGGFPYGASHLSELQYLFDLPTAQITGALSENQKRLAASMKRYWASFVESGAPSSASEPKWPRFDADCPKGLSFTLPRPQIAANFFAEHQCQFWAQVDSAKNLQK